MTSTSLRTRLTGIAVGAMSVAVTLAPSVLSAQENAPSAQEVREALETLRRFERALAAQAFAVDDPALRGAASYQASTEDPLSASTVGATPTARSVDAPASFALSLDGDMDLAGAVFRDFTPFIHTEGGPTANNTGLGLNALASVTVNGVFGTDNTAVGYRALRNTTEGFRNTAIGNQALNFNETGIQNTAVGDLALFYNRQQTVLGTGGDRNTAVGYRALRDISYGSNNTAIGYATGRYWQTSVNNIAIGFGAEGVPSDTGESNVIRIGGKNNQTQTFIEGIGVATGTFDTAVCIDVVTDQLGPCAVSSARAKEGVQALGDVHDTLGSLRPVSFRYRSSSAGHDDPEIRYGLLAEEVEEVLPSLVTLDERGRPHTVRYDLLAPLLLAELQRQDRELSRLRSLASQVTDLRKAVAAQQRSLQRLAERLNGR